MIGTSVMKELKSTENMTLARDLFSALSNIKSFMTEVSVLKKPKQINGLVHIIETYVIKELMMKNFRKKVCIV